MINVRILAGLCLLACLAGCAFGQDEGELTAKKRFLPGVGPGLRAVKRGADGNYYVLSAPGSSASVFDAAGKLLKRVPAFEESKSLNPQSSQLATITFGEDLDVDAQGTVYVADRGANAIKIWDTKGNERVVKINGPVAVAALPDGEVAVATVHEQHLVIVFDKNGRDVREFGDPQPISERPEVNRFLNIGMLVTDGGGHYTSHFLTCRKRPYGNMIVMGTRGKIFSTREWMHGQRRKRLVKRLRGRRSAGTLPCSSASLRRLA